jgi:phosphoribosylanthranilate isomerase
MKIKVCGMTLPEQVNALEEMGVDLAGFIFYPASPRYMGVKIAPEKMKKIGGRIGKVGVFVNETYENILHTVDNYRLDMVQVHGDESERFCEKLSNYVTVIKAFRLGEKDPVDWMVKPYNDCCDMFMFDTLGAGYGGTGKKFDWKVLKGKKIDKLFFISGGVEPGDVADLKDFEKDPVAGKLFAVDINTKFEVSAGIKDIKKLKTFVNEMNA